MNTIYRIDLHTDPKHRWDHVVDEKIEALQKLDLQMKEEIRKTLGWFNAFIFFPIFFAIMSCFTFLLDREYLREMQGISKRSNISMNKLLQLNIGYDFLAKCTSIVCHDKKENKVWHLRNMDWDTQLLRELTVNVRFYDGDTLKYECITWVGFVGIMTACRHISPPNYTCLQNESYIAKCKCSCVCPKDVATISLNFRKEDNSIVRNIFRFFLGYQPTSFAVRRWLENNNTHSLLSCISPCYLTIGTKTHLYIYECGKQFKKRSYDIKCDLYSYEIDRVFDGNLNYLVQTNADLNIFVVNKKWAEGDPLLLDSVERKKVAIEELEKVDELDFQTCFNIMSTKPVQNKLTVYTSIMCIDCNTDTITLQSKVIS